jgi:cyclopropane-fatty-acyl-phospholipid synthase
MSLLTWTEAGWVPDPLIRMAIRYLLRQRLSTLYRASSEGATAAFADQLRNSPLALSTAAANDQHYEVPAAFFENMLGPRLKYSCCCYESPAVSLGEAEVEMLRWSCERADLHDGMSILELGCGWGSLTLWMAEQYPASHIVAVSNSVGQRIYIEQQARLRGFANVQVVTADMCDFDTPQQFQRVLSVEMFEHMRNYQLLLARIARWLTPDGKVFVHLFCHREQPYVFEAEGAANWMGRHFFTGGMMPSVDLLHHFPDDLVIHREWRVTGMHYAHTCEAWLENLDRNRVSILELFDRHDSPAESRRRYQRWRMFVMACAELFRYRGGQEWFVAHYLLQHAPSRVDAGSVESSSVGSQ